MTRRWPSIVAALVLWTLPANSVSLEIGDPTAVDVLPARRKQTTAFGYFESSFQQKETKVVLQRCFVIGGVLFPPKYYAELRGFYDLVLSTAASRAWSQSPLVRRKM